MTYNLLDDPIGQRIVRAVGPRHNSWRTPGGIARASRLSLEEVESYISAHSDLFSRSEIAPGGTPLYCLKDPRSLSQLVRF